MTSPKARRLRPKRPKSEARRAKRVEELLGRDVPLPIRSSIGVPGRRPVNVVI